MDSGPFNFQDMNILDVKNIQAGVQNLSTLAFSIHVYIISGSYCHRDNILRHVCDQSEIKLTFLLYHRVLYLLFFKDMWQNLYLWDLSNLELWVKCLSWDSSNNGTLVYILKGDLILFPWIYVCDRKWKSPVTLMTWFWDTENMECYWKAKLSKCGKSMSLVLNAPFFGILNFWVGLWLQMRAEERGDTT